MPNELEVTCMDEILYDNAGAEKAASRFTEFFASEPEAVRKRDPGGQVPVWLPCLI
jgi:hypothetical protein